MLSCGLRRPESTETCLENLVQGSVPNCWSSKIWYRILYQIVGARNVGTEAHWRTLGGSQIRKPFQNENVFRYDIVLNCLLSRNNLFGPDFFLWSNDVLKFRIFGRDWLLYIILILKSMKSMISIFRSIRWWESIFLIHIFFLRSDYVLKFRILWSKLVTAPYINENNEFNRFND